MNETQRVLTDALELLRTKGWTNGRCSVDVDGNRCASDSPGVAKVSVCGAVCVCGGLNGSTDRALDALRYAGRNDTVSCFASQLSTLAEVEAWFARAIEAAGKDGE